jgi:hypothetical protein
MIIVRKPYVMAASAAAIIVLLLLLVAWGRHHRGLTQSTQEGSEGFTSSSLKQLEATTTPELVHRRDAHDGTVKGKNLNELIDPQLSPAEVSANYRAIAMRAENGDINALKVLHSALQGCDHVPQGDTARKESLALLDEGLKASGSQAYVEQLRQQEIARYRRCDLFTSEQISDDLHWLELAVRNGLDELIGDYYWKGIALDSDNLSSLARKKEFASEAGELLADAAKRGSPDAFLVLSDAYSRGTLNAQVDPVKAYAYMAAYTMLQPEQSGPAADHVTSNLTRMGNKLTPAQVHDAQNLASSILAECCGWKG